MQLSIFLTFLIFFCSFQSHASFGPALIHACKLGVGTVSFFGLNIYFASDLYKASNALGNQSEMIRLRLEELYPSPVYLPCSAGTSELKEAWKNRYLKDSYENMLLKDWWGEKCYRIDATGNRHYGYNDVSRKFTHMHQTLMWRNDNQDELNSLDLHDPLYDELMDNAQNDEVINRLYTEKFLPLRAKFISDAKRNFQLRALRDIAILAGLSFLSAKKLMKK
jgi:hypothetical protein